MLVGRVMDDNLCPRGKDGHVVWCVASARANHDNANKRRHDCRQTVADLIGIALRDKVDIATRDFNQSGYYWGECVKHAIRIYEAHDPDEEVFWGYDIAT